MRNRLRTDPISERPSNGVTSSGGAQRRGRWANNRKPALDFDDLIYGIHAVEEALLAGERLRSIAVAADRTKDAAAGVG